MTFEIDQDEGEDLEDKLEELVIRSLVILGLLFIMLAVALKQVRLTAIVIFSILLAIVICLSLFYFFGVSVNFITISGLTVCFGMLLDNSILVLDAIHRRLSGNRDGDSRDGPDPRHPRGGLPHHGHHPDHRGGLPVVHLHDRPAVACSTCRWPSAWASPCWPRSSWPSAGSPWPCEGPAEKEHAQHPGRRRRVRPAGWSMLWRWALGVLILAAIVPGGRPGLEGPAHRRWTPCPGSAAPAAC